MRLRLTTLLFFALTVSKSQTADLVGIYQVNWTGPSARYLILDCDSTYHFITHWDFGGKKDIEPKLDENKSWKLGGHNLIALETPFGTIKSLEILNDGRLFHKLKKETGTWTKIASFDSDCSVISFIQGHDRSHYYTVTKFGPELQVKFIEHYKNEQLTERVTYFELSESEIRELDLMNKFPIRQGLDLVTTIKVRSSFFETFWPVEKIEKWDKDEATIQYFDKSGQEIKKGD